MEGDDETTSVSMIDDETTSISMIDDEIYSNGDGEENRSKPNLSSELLDVEVYAGLYSGRTKVTRLMFIADRCGNQVMKLDALRMAYDEIKKGENKEKKAFHSVGWSKVCRPKSKGEVVEKIDGKLGSEYCLDQTWVDTVDRKAEVRKEKLESELNAYRTNLIKESIRMGYNDFGDFYYSHGHLGDAFKNYVRTRDYCTTSKHILQMCLNAILVSIEMGQFTHVATYVSKAEQTPDALDPVAIAKLRCAAGLAHLESKKYKLAARKFLETGPELANTYTEVIAPQDVATYGGLCALASFDRAELKSKVIDNFNFRNFLELVPEVREIINDFYSSRYASCLEFLENLKANLLLDIHLHDHVETLYSLIRHRTTSVYLHACDYDESLSDMRDNAASMLQSRHLELKSEAAAAASLKVEECRGLVEKFSNALLALPDLQKSMLAESQVEQLEIQIADINLLLKDKKRVKGKERMALDGNKSSLCMSLKQNKLKLHSLTKKAEHGIRGKSKEDLQTLLTKAELELSEAVEIRSRLRAEHAASRKLKSEMDTQMLSQVYSEDG
ncbi:hypothetical protein MKX03_018674 [Papaver bracteatum]|nr:hypothetical protein MKX03_018674 [Papaver bracteatum]